MASVTPAVTCVFPVFKVTAVAVGAEPVPFELIMALPDVASTIKKTSEAVSDVMSVATHDPCAHAMLLHSSRATKSEKHFVNLIFINIVFG